ncbi:hypothetical protein PHYSODRAFT_336870 [Phytophthora sojae]|uniref:Uncharacterized protein n=1 Tax=Phytophthora sojae (strain P6497) TaxID=1094619 RepID=G4ZWS0_PHYSP|nr:hypothetical protein PHYSODRAFT_336870 [Phytophthora sojae]EGZ12444.1 hypothetical protein PHYSODRAFT_336870 [Phytophthora sojae]|eukprot:XP_009532777.1 hypothetical protein PHYSODRAFT_336870 [Phytophthora sojae]
MAVSLAVVKRVAARLEAMLVVDEASVAARRLAAFRDAGVPLPRPSPTHVDTPVGTRYLIDAEMQKALSTFVRRSCLSFEETVRLWRGQHAADARPNKALRGHHLAWLPHGYDKQALLLKVIADGVCHNFREGSTIPRQLSRNHKSANTLENALCRSIREGQDAGTYLVVDIDVAERWSVLSYSPFGCVPKADTDPALEARVIHDLSFPVSASVNDRSDPDELPQLIYEHIGAIARRIEISSSALRLRQSS